MNNKQAKIIPEKIHLFSIKVFKSNLETSDTFLNSPQKVEGFEFALAKQLAHNFQANKIRFRLFFTLSAYNAQNKTLGLTAEYGIEFHFEVDNLNDFTIDANETSNLDTALGATLLGIAYSTSRGIVLERMQGTFFEGVILPVIDPFEELIE